RCPTTDTAGAGRTRRARWRRPAGQAPAPLRTTAATPRRPAPRTARARHARPRRVWSHRAVLHGPIRARVQGAGLSRSHPTFGGTLLRLTLYTGSGAAP